MSRQLFFSTIADSFYNAFRRPWRLVLAAPIILCLLFSPSFAIQSASILIAPDPDVLLRGQAEAQQLTPEQLSAQATRLMYESFRDYYYFRKQIQLDVEMLLRETYLHGVYISVNQELTKRDPSSRFFETGLVEEDTDSYGEDPRPDLADTISIREEYLKTNDFIRAEYHHKLIYVEALKAKLVTEGTSDEVKRMFDYDLRLAYDAYDVGSDAFYDKDAEDRLLGFPLAILRLNHILELYPYSNMDDILFYRGEAEYGSDYFNTAAQTFEKLISEYPGSDYYIDALARLFFLHQRLEHYMHLGEMWTEYGSIDFGFDAIVEFDRRWDEISDSLEMEDLERAVVKQLDRELDQLDRDKPFTREDVEKSSKLYYAAGMGLYLSGVSFAKKDPPTARSMFFMAQDALGRVPNFTDNKFKAAYLEGQALTRLGKYEEAIEPYTLIAEERFKESKNPSEFVLSNDARVKLGYCYSLINNYDQSIFWFSQVDDETESYKNALLGMAWTNYRWDKYALVDSLTQLIIDRYPNDPQFYEAVTLAGYNREMIGQHDRAMTAYEAMISRLDNITDIGVYIQERRTIAERIQEARSLEPMIVESDDPDLFSEYLEVTQDLDRLYKRVKLAEIVTLNPVMEEFLHERDSIRVVFDSLVALQDSIFGSDRHRSLRGSYERLANRLQKLAKTIQMGGYTIIHQDMSVSQQMAEIRYHNQITNDMIDKADDERTEVDAALAEMRRVRELLSQTGNLDQWIELEMAENDLLNARNSFEEQIVSLSEGRMAEITVDIESWRDFAFRRYALQGLDFDSLIEQMQMLDDLNDRISAIQTIIEEKAGDDEDTRRPPTLEETGADGESGSGGDAPGTQE